VLLSALLPGVYAEAQQLDEHVREGRKVNEQRLLLSQRSKVVLREHEAVVEERVALVRELDAHDARARALIEGMKTTMVRGRKRRD